MSNSEGNLIVYYDGACPRCVADRKRYERIAGKAGETVQWFDITGRDEELKKVGIDPEKALRELHVRDAHGNIHRELDAYILLMRRTWLLRPLAWLIGLPGIRALISRCYHAWVDRRLRASGRG
ncbi:thiol-disulfide oxidoreductase DCC family protein [Marinimicrobium locisalis]|uniref:thiol-disulfide oxidoreductase DCC family protein n=1 Tax=Marinimicrobium locisalis TaxID=546022 RepID=UPI003221F240